MQALAGFADQIGEPALDIEMDVFQVDGPAERAGLDLGLNRRHASLDIGEISGGKHADARHHACVRERAADIVFSETLVEAD